MDALIKWLGKTSLTAIAWVFVLSIHWNGQPIFNHAYDVLIDNSIVRAIDEKFAELWDNVSETAKNTVENKKEKERI